MKLDLTCCRDGAQAGSSRGGKCSKVCEEDAAKRHRDGLRGQEMQKS